MITLGGRDGGIPLEGAAHKLVPCCGTPWLELYADRVRPLIRAYLRGGRGRVYWLLLPAPHEALRAPLFEAVNDAVRLMAGEFGASLRLIRERCSDLTGRIPGHDHLRRSADPSAHPGRNPPHP